jgi:hypothetical protein
VITKTASKKKQAPGKIIFVLVGSSIEIDSFMCLLQVLELPRQWMIGNLLNQH